MNWINHFIVKIMPIFPRAFISLFSRRYIAGETLPEAIATSQQLNGAGIWITMDVLGENITRLDEATAAKNACLQVLDAIQQNQILGNISLKLTQLGLKIDPSACIENVTEIVERARQYNNFVRIDMEDSTCTDDTLEICLKMHQQYERLGTVIQACLKRSEADVRMLAEQGINLRICKGIYDESADIAYKKRQEVQEHYMRLIELMMDQNCYVGIATHDPILIDHAYSAIKQRNLTPDRYEFQMLLGVAETRREKIVAADHHLRVYVPFGEQWYAYSIRRLKENPQMAGYILKNLFIRN